ncbi:MAG: tRNA (adenosine(37)-N6)-threonylcarbamoyltransferase complex transferase subunit TsaD [Halanaerobiales bacterium]|nr:tRNA (adenosine(37)-N6)-threonylcarbamoyltransferase complex transferase subunit TsaD [Halanaerobiales bacterium]
MSDKKIKILAIETSCDETAAAVSEDGLNILSSVVASQIDWHKKYGGVVPEIASRKHMEFITPVVDKAIEESNIELKDIDAIAATYGPGLVGSLLVGLSYAKALSLALDKPFIGVNHIAGHIYANFISKRDIKSPVVCLTVSGGHTDLLYFKEYGDYEILGRTKDDAAGEAFDKIARYLGLGYPGGPVIEQKAKEGNEQAVDFPRPFIDKDNYDFSFSGLKTAVINYIHNQKQKNIELNINDIAASFQKAVIDILTNKTIKAALSKNAESVILSGGVAANKRFREVLESSLKKYDIPLYFPEMKLCTDNAAMISTVAYYQYLKKDFATHDLNADPNLKL